MKRARYICLEGTEGVGKTTQTSLLVEVLREKGYSVLQTKEPGTPLIPITMELRKIMLDNEYDSALTNTAREFISQAIRSIHLEQLVVPALNNYDFIIQDRGILSAYAYGAACGNNLANLRHMAHQIVDAADSKLDNLPIYAERIYDTVIYLKGDYRKGLHLARSSKKEFSNGDAIESRGETFMSQVSFNMDHMCGYFNTVKIDINSKTVQEVHKEILDSLGLGN